jgi:hypothetical protein
VLFEISQQPLAIRRVDEPSVSTLLQARLLGLNPLLDLDRIEVAGRNDRHVRIRPELHGESRTRRGEQGRGGNRANDRHERSCAHRKTPLP